MAHSLVGVCGMANTNCNLIVLSIVFLLLFIIILFTCVSRLSFVAAFARGFCLIETQQITNLHYPQAADRDKVVAFLK